MLKLFTQHINKYENDNEAMNKKISKLKNTLNLLKQQKKIQKKQERTSKKIRRTTLKQIRTLRMKKNDDITDKKVELFKEDKLANQE